MIKGLVCNSDKASVKMFFVSFFSVIKELDDLKRNENGARNAIRWLEREFKEGTTESFL